MSDFFDKEGLNSLRPLLGNVKGFQPAIDTLLQFDADPSKTCMEAMLVAKSDPILEGVPDEKDPDGKRLRTFISDARTLAAPVFELLCNRFAYLEERVLSFLASASASGFTTIQPPKADADRFPHVFQLKKLENSLGQIFKLTHKLMSLSSSKPVEDKSEANMLAGGVIKQAPAQLEDLLSALRSDTDEATKKHQEDPKADPVEYFKALFQSYFIDKDTLALGDVETLLTGLLVSQPLLKCYPALVGKVKKYTEEGESVMARRGGERVCACMYASVCARVCSMEGREEGKKRKEKGEMRADSGNCMPFGHISPLCP